MSAGNSPNVRKSIFERDGWTCRACGFQQTPKERRAAAVSVALGRAPIGRWLTIDHIVPVSKGGNERRENLQTLCNRCNEAKGDRCDPADLVPIRLRKRPRLSLRKTVTRSGPIHDPRCDSEFCFHTCPVHLAKAAA